MKKKSSVSIRALLALLPCVLSGETEFDQLIDKMEQDVLQLVLEVEAAYEKRCISDTLQECYNNNYEECVSEYPSPSCPGGVELGIPVCGNGTDSCSGLFDYTVSTTRIPSELATGVDRNPEEANVKETICYSHYLDDWFVEKYKLDEQYWEELGVESLSKMFGARDGIFRIFPARHSRTCGEYDPRQRPWYIAASSGPKNIIVILDKSGSMDGYPLELLKTAASQIVSTVTVADRVAIVEFPTNASVIADSNGRLLTATKENKERLLEEIHSMVAIGETNFYAAFTAAFGALEKTIDAELHVDCNTAILFLTDGKMTKYPGVEEDDIIVIVNEKIRDTESRTKHPVLLMTYSVGIDSEIHDLPKRLACSTELGVWSKIADEDKLIESLTSYYLLFAIGLGDSDKDFVAWVEPYRFYTNDQLGTTASAPVYDRSMDPHILIGVAGYTFSLAAFDSALGVPAESQETLDKIVLRSTAKCPSLSFSLCELESFRRHGTAGEEGLCFPNNCTVNDYVVIEPEGCSFQSDYPTFVWNNANYDGK